MKKILIALVLIAFVCGPAAMAGKKGGGGGGHHAAKASGGGGGAKHAGIGRQKSGGGAMHQRSLGGKSKFAGGRRTHLKTHALAGKGVNRRMGLRRHALHTRAFNRINGKFVGRRWHVRGYSIVFHNYHAVFHDHWWWRHHYRVVLVGGGWYYWNAGYWYPAWGYDPAFALYAYDGPIYTYDNLPPDQVIINIQSELQFQGYYNGEIDGQLGPQTRAAIADYQRDHKLEITSAADEPTVDSLGLT